MPDSDTLARMYGPEYAIGVAADVVDDPKNPELVLAFLQSGGLEYSWTSAVAVDRCLYA